MTMQDYITLYIDTTCNSENTKVAYRADLDSMAQYINKEPQYIKPIDILDWKNSMANDSSATVARRLGTVKRFFSFLYDNNYLPLDPTKAIKLPRIVNKNETTLTREEIDLLLGACKNPRDTAILTLMASTGLRVSELCNIMVGDIDENNNIKILGKGNKWRVVHLNDKVMHNINLYIKTRKRDCNNLFVSNQGTPMTQGTINHTLKTLARRAGIDKNIHPHMLRHYFASETLERGVPIDMISIAMGHSNVSVTQRYAQRRDKRAVVESIMNVEIC